MRGSGSCSLDSCLQYGIYWTYTSTSSTNRSRPFSLCFLVSLSWSMLCNTVRGSVNLSLHEISYLESPLQVLKVYPFPATVTAFQFGCGTVLINLMWILNLHPKPRISRSQVIFELHFQGKFFVFGLDVYYVHCFSVYRDFPTGTRAHSG